MVSESWGFTLNSKPSKDLFSRAGGVWCASQVQRFTVRSSPGLEASNKRPMSPTFSRSDDSNVLCITVLPSPKGGTWKPFQQRSWEFTPGWRAAGGAGPFGWSVMGRARARMVETSARTQKKQRRRTRKRQRDPLGRACSTG